VVMAVDRHVVAVGGGFVSDGPGRLRAGPLVHFALGLSGAERPAVCVLHTATGDDPSRYTASYGALSGAGARVSHLALFPMPNHDDPRAHLLAQDLVWVGGGSSANLMAVWWTHGLDSVMREAWEAGVVLAGSSAGALCWFESGTTDSFGPELRSFSDGIGLIRASFCPHYDSEARRRPTYHRLIGDATLAPGWGCDDGAALHFVGTELAEVVADRPAVTGWRVEGADDGGVSETRLDVREVG